VTVTGPGPSPASKAAMAEVKRHAAASKSAQPTLSAEEASSIQICVGLKC
jgi:hypothetical protein